MSRLTIVLTVPRVPGTRGPYAGRSDDSIGDGKTVEFTGDVLPRDRYIIHPRRRGPVMTPRDQLIDLFRISFDNGLNVSVRKVPDPTHKADSRRLLGGGLPKKDALDPPADPHARPHRFSHY